MGLDFRLSGFKLRDGVVDPHDAVIPVAVDPFGFCPFTSIDGGADVEDG